MAHKKTRFSFANTGKNLQKYPSWGSPLTKLFRRIYFNLQENTWNLPLKKWKEGNLLGILWNISDTLLHSTCECLPLKPLKIPKEELIYFFNLSGFRTKDVFRTQPDIYDEAYLQKWLAFVSRLLISLKNIIIGDRLSC